MRKVKIVDAYDLESEKRGLLDIALSKDFQEAINRLFKEIAEENGSIVKTTYLRGSAGRLETAIIEYEVPGEEGYQVG